MFRKLFSLLTIILMTTSPAAAQDNPEVAVEAFKQTLLELVNAKDDKNRISSDRTNQLAEEIHKKYKKNVKVLVGVAEAYSTIKDTASSYRFYNYAIRVNPKDMTPYVAAGKWEETEETRQSYERALAWYEKAIKANPKDSTGYLCSARLLSLKLGDDDAAAAKIKEIAAFNSTFPVNLNIARIYSKTQKGFAKSFQYFANEDLNKFEVEDLMDYSTNCILVAGHFEEGIPVIEFAIKKYPTYPQLCRVARMYAMGQKKYQEAVEYGENFFANRTEKVKILDDDYVQLAEAYQKLNKTDKAIEVYERTIVADSIGESSRNNSYRQMATIYKDLGEWDQAYATYQRLFAQQEADGKPNASDMMTYAQLYQEQAEELNGEEKLDAYHKALKAWEYMAEKSPENASVAYYYALAVCPRIDPILKTDLLLPYASQLVSLMEGKSQLSEREQKLVAYAYYSLSFHYWQNEDWQESLRYAELNLKYDPENSTCQQIKEKSIKLLGRRRR